MGKCSKDKRDPYYRLAKEQGWRARSAFKLLHIDEEFGILQGVKKVVDLCAAPGSWSQVLAKKLRNGDASNDSSIKIVAVDLQPMAPITGVTQLQGDITKTETADAILAHFSGERADLVVCDGAPDVTGMHDLDEFIQSQLLVAALNITTHILKKGATFVAKVFRGRDVALIVAQLRCLFQDVAIVKPRSSRNSSLESFVVCRNYSPPADFRPSMCNPLMTGNFDWSDFEGVNRIIVPFIACGDINNFDADRNYALSADETGRYDFKAPIQPPIAPPYSLAVKLRRANKLASGKLNDIGLKAAAADCCNLTTTTTSNNNNNNKFEQQQQQQTTNNNNATSAAAAAAADNNDDGDGDNTMMPDIFD